MIVAMPTGVAHGWGIAGQHIWEEVAHLLPVPGVTLHSMKNPDFSPTFSDAWNRINIGYCFFENDIEAYRHMEQAAAEWDYIVAGSSWCEYHLRLGGVQQTSTILQGIDPADFYPGMPRQDDGRFIVFSGGKFELRKSQDVVIAATKVMMERHSDVWLSCAWHNQWPHSIATMSGTPYIDFEMDEGLACDDLLRATLVRNRIAIERVMVHQMACNNAMREIYLQSDIGLFPNRCEGGNNMVMSEYMACGRTVIASDKTGHADVITEQNALPLRQYRQQVIEWGGRPSAIWFQPSVEETIELLECAYWNRGLLNQKAEQAAKDLGQLSWHAAAVQFHQIAVDLAGVDYRASVTDYVESAELLLGKGRMDLAIMKLKQAIRIAPAEPALYRMVAGLQETAGQMAEAAGYRMKADTFEQMRKG
ncbi:MAG: glycosyltransferase [Trichlorobacter sp.]|uniref:glycosyltransferase n=1 Tax=Trichlorobacter sp. TaxID=2911007 RepID=UPI00256E4B39|nr:glycosyltransferase [Trichlorobacter sp.]MDK9717038.1 glycosyltransferase [Trichlorobacter sp.]